MPLNTNNIIKFIQQHNPSEIIVGYSGGIDSSVLLDISTQIKNLKIIAIHINHNINKNAELWQQHCLQKCKNRNILFISHKLSTVPKGESFEAWASKQRMFFFEQEMAKYKNPILLLGHHQDDQAETFLLQAVRGAGIAGLSAMSKSKIVTNGIVLRPLLNISRKHIEEYALVQNIKWINDDSNADTKYRRNFIRHKITPTLAELTPAISTTLSRSASLCAKANNIISKLLDRELQSIINTNDLSLSKDKLIAHDFDIQEGLVHLWFKNTTNIALKQKQINSIIKNLNSTAATGWKLNINSNYNIILEYGFLKIIKATKENISNDKTIHKWLFKNGINIDFEQLVIRDRKSDDKCKYKDRNKKNKLKIILQELKIPTRDRNQIRIIEYNSEIIAVFPFFVCA